MTHTTTAERFSYYASATGILIPVLYFGIQLIALPFAEKYSIMHQTASELGMVTVSSVPNVFNVGTMLRGGIMLITALGFFTGFKRLHVRPISAWLTCLSMVSIAINDIRAGLLPLPDDRHEGIFLIGYVFWPFACLAACWHFPNNRWFKIYLLANIALTYILLAAKLSVSEAWMPSGLFQRIFSVVTVIPLGVAAGYVVVTLRQSSRAKTVHQSSFKPPVAMNPL